MKNLRRFMSRITKLNLVILFLLQSYHAAIGAPDYPFEGLLPRTETIFIGHITKQSQQNVTFEISEVLRGQTPQKTMMFEFSGVDDRRLPESGSSFLVISQGDNHFGKPKAVISLGQVLKGQAGYCGWVAFPLRVVDDSQYLDLIYTRVGQKPDEKPARLTLEKARILIQQVLFQPDLHGKGV